MYNMQQRLVLILCLCAALPTAQAQDPDIDHREQELLDELFRTSDVDGQQPTSGRKKKDRRMSAPPGAVRIGCTCMDDTYSDAHSSGACSGRGGVRYWHYRTREGDTSRVLTARHEQHPQPLDSIERSLINQPRPPDNGHRNAANNPFFPSLIIQPAPYAPLPIRNDPQPFDGGLFDWSDAATITGGGLSLYLIIRYVLGWVHHHQPLVRYALRHFLRFGKQPKTRKGRQDPPATRL